VAVGVLIQVGFVKNVEQRNANDAARYMFPQLAGGPRQIYADSAITSG